MHRRTALIWLLPWLVVFGLEACAEGASLDEDSNSGDDDDTSGSGGDGGGSSSGIGDPCEQGETLSCYSGPEGTRGVGVCADGTAACADGVVVDCIGAVGPSVETCDSLDNDCDGVADEDEPGAGEPCTTGMTGICAMGTSVCVGGMVTCVPATMQQVETCNALDDDCDGSVDDGNPGGGTTCSTGLPGPCNTGSMTCQNGTLGCVQSVFPQFESCFDGIDNDCNGITDDFCCPYVYSHDGERYEYETSVGGAAVAWHADHLRDGKAARFNPLLVRLDRVKPAGGGAGRGIHTRLLAAEDEIVYVRELALVSIEHPAGCEIISSSSIHWPTLGREDPGEVLALRSEAMRALVRAVHNGSVDVTESLSTRDDRAAAFDPRRVNSYDVDFGAVTPGASARLVIDGWKYKVQRRLHAGVSLQRPSLAVRQPDGTFREVMKIAAPRGDRKTVAFDLSGIDFPTGRYELRISTGTHERGCALWLLDRVRLTEDPPEPVTIRRSLPVSADLAFRGAPTITAAPDFSTPRHNVDDGRARLWDEQRTWGSFTRYGDVRELVARADDRLVVMRRGDALDATFAGAEPGPTRTLMLEVSLVVKPRRLFDDPVRDRACFVEPLPYAAMRVYPPPPRPVDPAHEHYRRTYNTRTYEPGDPSWGRRAAAADRCYFGGSSGAQVETPAPVT